MFARLTFKHRPMDSHDVFGPEFGPVRIEDAMTALGRSRRYSSEDDEDAEALSRLVTYACTPQPDSLAIFFVQGTKALEVHIEPGPDRDIYDLTELVYTGVHGALSQANLKPTKVRIRLLEEGPRSRPIGISGKRVVLVELFLERISVRNTIATLVGSISLFVVALLISDKFWTSAVVPAISVGSLIAVSMMVAVVEYIQNRSSRLRWVFKKRRE